MKPDPRPARHQALASAVSPAIRRLGETRTGRWLLTPGSGTSSRAVTLHVLHRQWASKGTLARFQNLQSSLCRVAHPTVVKTHEAGVDETGRVYFLMDAVQGTGIDEFCRSRGVDWLERVELMERVCEGLQRAHDDGVVHHGLEPGCVFVSGERDRRVVEVAGFGVATALFGENGPPALDPMRNPGEGIEYMSPEQTGHVSLPLDSRADVRALGVILHQLLIGALPHDAPTIRRSLSMGMLDWMYRDGPLRASVRFEVLGDAAPSIATARGATVGELADALRDGLDDILARALARDPHDRFESPGELGRALRGYREHSRSARSGVRSHGTLESAWLELKAVWRTFSQRGALQSASPADD